VGAHGPSEKQKILSAPQDVRREYVHQVTQSSLLNIMGCPISYATRSSILDLLMSGTKLLSMSPAYDGISTTDNSRLLRFTWEVDDTRSVWKPYAKGGSTKRWSGLNQRRIAWGDDGKRVKLIVEEVNGYAHWSRQIRSADRQFTRAGLTYSLMGRGKLAFRVLNQGTGWDTVSRTLLPADEHMYSILAYLNSRLASVMARTLSPELKFSGGYVSQIPIPDVRYLAREGALHKFGLFALRLSQGMDEYDPTEDSFLPKQRNGERSDLQESMIMNLMSSLRSACEGLIEKTAASALLIDAHEHEAILSEVGMPAGWNPFLTGYDAMPILPRDLVLPDEMIVYLAVHTRRTLDVQELARLKARLRALYEFGPGTSAADETIDGTGLSEDDIETVAAGAYPPIPPETFVEEMSHKLQINPISVYWLIQEICAEGARCMSEEQRLLEDRLSVIVLRLLGHRWPRQVEAAEMVPNWANQNGIIPLMPGSGEMPLADCVRERLRVEDGDLGSQRAEALLVDLTGQNLETWLRRSFFPRHVRQFKYRPIAWHLASTRVTVDAGRGRGSRSRGGTRQASAFECVVYYHACGLGLLARLRTQYVEPLLRVERSRVDVARQAGDDTTAAQATARAQELDAFMERLRGVEEQGFDTSGLEEELLHEPLDRWSGDGVLAPASRDALLAQERAWAVDINDGVRVNISPLQLAGVLPSDVLKEADARKAIVERARWRADERRWAREGVLPRCGWMDEDIPASPRWVERAPERQVEQRKRERKRAEAMARLVQGDGGSEE